MVRLRGITVEIVVDGQPATEYDNDDTEPDTGAVVTRYIEAVSSKEFHFAIKVDPLYSWGEADTTTARPRFDGKKGLGICIQKKNLLPMPTHVSKIEGEWSGSGGNAKLHKYVFADLQTREAERSDNVASMKEKYSKLGLLTVEIWREQAISLTDSVHDIKIGSLHTVPEKALKGQALDVATTFKACPATRPQSLSTRPLDVYPFLTFNFKYRTKRALQTLMVLERSQSPVPLEHRDPEDLSREELQELVRRQRAAETIKREHKSLKRERANTSTTPMPPLKSSRGANGQMIYHIDSDDEAEVKTTGDKQARESSPTDSEIEVVTL